MKINTIIWGSCTGVLLLSGCMGESIMEDKAIEEEKIQQESEKNDLTSQVIIDEDGTEKPVLGYQSNTVQGKTATIRSTQEFEEIENSTLIIEEKTVTVINHIKDSTITLKSGSSLILPYLKNSTITVEEGAILEITERIKESKVIDAGGKISIDNIDTDDKSEVVEQ